MLLIGSRTPLTTKQEIALSSNRNKQFSIFFMWSFCSCMLTLNLLSFHELLALIILGNKSTCELEMRSLKYFCTFQKPSWEKAAKIMKERSGSISFAYLAVALELLGAWSSKFWNKVVRMLIEILTRKLFFRYDPEMDGRILLGKVDCTQEHELCRR